MEKFEIYGKSRRSGTFSSGMNSVFYGLQDMTRFVEDEAYARKMEAWKRRLAEIREELAQL